jgi:hypothetical protein
MLLKRNKNITWMNTMLRNIPSKETNPHATHIMRQRPTDCVPRKTPFGETNIPEPDRKKQ